MKSQEWSLLDRRVEFRSSSPIGFGSQLTVLANPIERTGGWLTSVLEPSSREEKVIFGIRPKMGQIFIVMSEPKKQDTGFLNWAVLVEVLEEMVESIENNLLKKLGENAK